jgi:hypothetical protein
MYIEMEHNERSSWREYPEKYKIFSMNFQLSSDINYIERNTMDILTFLGDIGGLYGLGISVFGTLFVPFAQKRMDAILTNRLFHLSTKQQDLID